MGFFNLSVVLSTHITFHLKTIEELVHPLKKHKVLLFVLEEYIAPFL
jgi:hypothetical protein